MKKCEICQYVIGTAAERNCTRRDCSKTITGTKEDILATEISMVDLDPAEFDKNFAGTSLLADLQTSGVVPEKLSLTLDTVPGHLL